MIERGFNIQGYEEAGRIVRRGFERNVYYMRSLIAKVTGDGAYADNLDYRGLLTNTRRIIAVAEKILKDRDANRINRKLEEKFYEGRIIEEQGSLF
jgi:hypothetical protein